VPRTLIRAGLRCLTGFARNTGGSVTVEFVMWVPVFCGLLMLFADTSLTYMNQSNFWNVSRETARIVARHGFDAEAAVAYAENHASFGKYRPDVHVSIDGTTVTVTITADTSAISLFGILNFAEGQTVQTSVTDVLEPI
jgi:Flp pilus assembly protein TadG